MKNVECAEVKVGQVGTVVFEIGDMVSVGNLKDSIDKIWQKDDGSVRLELKTCNQTFGPEAVRFLNRSAETMVSNILLDVFECETNAKNLKSHLRKIKALKRAMERRRISLEKTHKLCQEAVNAQLMKEFPDLF